MSLASFYRQLQRFWRSVREQLWPELPPDPLVRERQRLTRRLQRVQARMLAVQRSLSQIATWQRRKERLSQHLASEIQQQVNTPEAMSLAIELERQRALLTRGRRRTARLEQRYRRLCDRYHATREKLARLSRRSA